MYVEILFVTNQISLGLQDCKALDCKYKYILIFLKYRKSVGIFDLKIFSLLERTKMAMKIKG